MTTRCVVFDFDDTLVLSEQAKRQAFFDVVDAHLHDDLARLLEQRPPLDRYSTFERLASETEAGVTTARAWVAAFEDRVEAAVGACPEVAGASGAIATLKRLGIHVAIVSDTPQDALRRVVGARVWADQVDEVLGRPIAKPEHLHRILDQLGIDPQMLVLVGDRESDHAAARAVGARFVGVRSRPDADPGDQAAWDDPDCGFPVLDDLTELVAVVADLAER